MAERKALRLTTPSEVDEYAASHNWVLIDAFEREEAYLTPEGAIVKVYYNKTGESIRAVIAETHVTGIG